MKTLQKTIQDLVTAIVRHPDQVLVIPVMGSANGFHVTVSETDYALVLSKADSIRTLAGSFAGLPEDQRPLILVSPRT